ncbi:MAG: cyclic nucleotide-binding domain-containing protein [Betaproteobacteria bacterium]|nr:cyclic nucleotide-binding domain-containing protein [Betaproteobacteria bacterium]
MRTEQYVDVEMVTALTWLGDALRENFGEFDDDFLLLMKSHLRWVHIKGGEVLFRQGEVDQTLYIVVGGRLRVLLCDELGETHVLGDMRRGETVGEMALITGEPRTATLVAVRDSVLVALSRASYEAVISRYPLVSMQVARFIIERIRPSLSKRRQWARPGVVAFLPATRGAPVRALVGRLLPDLERHGSVVRIDSAGACAALGADVLAAAIEGGSEEATHTVSRWVDAIETAHDMVVFVGDDETTPWSQYCQQHADEALFVADTRAAPGDLLPLPPPDDLSVGEIPIRAHRTLLLVHPETTRVPRDTAAWLDRIPADSHLHLREGHGGDYRRIARTLFGSAIGLVFGGGGARGFAHLGVLKAMEEAGIPVDFVGGTSIGSIMATYAAFDVSSSEAIAHARRAFAKNPTNDMNLFPLISLFGGKRLRSTINEGIRALAGFDAHIEDAWKPLFCIASNYSRAAEMVLRRGSLGKTVRASTAIPAALPPVVMDGDLVIDGGTFNNFPTDVMAGQRVGFIIGCDLSKGAARKLDMEDVPSPWQLALDRLRPRRSRRYRLPALSSIILNVSIMHSQARLKASRAQADVCFSPDLGRIGLLNWKAFDETIELGYRHARDVIAGLPEETRNRLARSAD